MTRSDWWDLRPFVTWIVDQYEPSVRVGPEVGAYASRPGGDDVELYGIADMACVLHTIDRLRPTAAERDQWAASFARFRDPATGHYVERGPATHVELHVTAFTIAAMELVDELVDAGAQHPLRFADAFRSPEQVTDVLDALDWRDWVYLDSHRGAAIGAIAANVPGLVDPAWFDAYFAALERRLDPANGMFGDAKPPTGDLDQIGGAFHYAFLYEWAHRRLPHARARVDAVLGLQRADGTWDPANPFWLTLDGVYLLTRGVRHTGHRRAEVEQAVADSVDAVSRVALDGPSRSAAFAAPMGTHALVAVVSLLAEAQSFLGDDRLVTDRPLRLVLDRRPFI